MPNPWNIFEWVFYRAHYLLNLMSCRPVIDTVFWSRYVGSKLCDISIQYRQKSYGGALYKKSLKWRHRESAETGSKHQSCLAVFSKICKPSFDQSWLEWNKCEVFLHIFHDGRDYSYLKTVKILTILAMQVVKTRSENSTCGVIFWCRILCHIVCVSILPLSVPTCRKSMNFPTIDTFDNR